MKLTGNPEILAETDEEIEHPDYAPAKVLKCAKCDGRLFEVASGEYLTVVQCATCREPSVVHSG